MEKQLRRVKQGSVLGGVAGGLAQYFNIDVVIVRLLLVMSLFVSFGVSLFAYIVLWVVLPEDNSSAYGYPGPAGPGDVYTPVSPVQPTHNRDRNVKIIAIGLIAFGGFMLLDQFNIWYSLSKYFWPFILIAIGAYLLLSKRDKEQENSQENPTEGPYTPYNGPSGYDGPSGPGSSDDSGDSIKVN